MEEQFDDILSRVLTACEGLDDTQIDAVLKELMAEEGFDENESDFVDKTFSLLEASSEQYIDLQTAKEDGIGRDEWLARKFDTMLKGRSDEEVDTVMKSVEQATELSVENEMEAAETDIDDTCDTSDNNIK